MKHSHIHVHHPMYILYTCMFLGNTQTVSHTLYHDTHTWQSATRYQKFPQSAKSFCFHLFSKGAHPFREVSSTSSNVCIRNWQLTTGIPADNSSTVHKFVQTCRDALTTGSPSLTQPAHILSHTAHIHTLRLSKSPGLGSTWTNILKHDHGL